MAREHARLSASVFLTLAVGGAFVLVGVAFLFIVRTNIRREAMREAEQKARIILDRNIATHTYFSHQLKPAVFPLSDRVMPPDYFEPTWMSSTYAVREIDKLFLTLNPADYYYKECAINARSPENEADPEERAFIGRLNREPGLKSESGVHSVGGKSYFFVLRRGEVMERACLRCHDVPEKAPSDLVARYGSVRSFHRDLNEVVSAISIRIPLAAAYAEADRTTLQISLALASGLLGLLGVLVLLTRRLVFAPLEKLRAKATEISTDERHLGEEISLPRGRELADLSASFNRMSKILRDDRDNLAQTVEERTADLRATNDKLKQALADIKVLGGLIPICASCKKIRDDRGFWQQIEAYITEHSDAQFSHGICPECFSRLYPELSPKAGPGGTGEGPMGV